MFSKIKDPEFIKELYSNILKSMDAKDWLKFLSKLKEDKIDKQQ